ncbi:hypothetical protein JXA05_04380, partial [Candidatus Peregrinibacteria bacterium]|nr:hypothetical protein [Candidatus Peregrinibacteria bacterium]
LAGYKADDRPPVVEYVTALSSELLEVEFSNYLRPSSLKLSPVTQSPQRLAEHAPLAPDFNIEIFEEGDSTKPLEVTGVEFGDAANILLVATAPQKSGVRYRVQIRDLTSAAGITPKVAINKMVKGFNRQFAQTQALSTGADLNGDGKVDFIDFTLFSAAYGTAVGQSVTTEEPASASSSVGQPLEPEPDSSVPHTSEPAGGEISAEPPASSPIIP